jgi:hypothetical protein
MKNIIPLLMLFLMFSCEKEVFTLQQVAPSKNINAVVLSIDSITNYSSINEDWFSIASNSTYKVSSKFYHNDSLGNITNLTNMIIDSNYLVKYELYSTSKSNISILDKNKEGTNLGLLFNIKTSTPEFGFMDVKVYNKKCETIFHYKYPFIVSPP